MVSLACAAGLVFVAGGLLWAYFALRRVGSPIVLHFNNFFGINQIGDISELFYMGITGIVAILVDLAIALELEARDRFWGKFLAVAALAFGILIFIAFAVIISVN